MRREVRMLVASTLIAALALSLDSQAQEKKPAPAPTAPGAPAAPVAAPQQQQDRLDIGNTLDSWYKVYQYYCNKQAEHPLQVGKTSGAARLKAVGEHGGR